MNQAPMFHALQKKWVREREARRIRSEDARHRLVREGREDSYYEPRTGSRKS